ncbi:hypothetical protein BZA05DRAFT_215838 [Tricharina praecox]|uniref:uncharacterized protein n=1 Tax=Tricharina praecox TaxID=43433 RepID=UPI00222041A5|nr:uncharacterized protein BZA05DRAFT_215838 [Tricharina praecox]KAI5855694.1 hypothetical protein BZA05DRAFT_215838 [Tricharina praecox]
MSMPLPETPLGSHCSAIRENILYTFSETAFQSLELTNGSEWKTLPLNVGTAGAECVIANRGTTDESLYIVGGSTTNPDNVPAKGFMGLQRWSFATEKWETIQLPDPVTFNLTGHGATFLEDTQRIIVFAGTKYPAVNVASANTFLIQAAAPNEIISLPAQNPLLSPMVMPWGTGGALIVGGDADNKALTTYVTATGWGGLDSGLDTGLPTRGSAWASLMDGDDGSRMLITFDLTTSPATVGTKKVKDKATSKTRRRREREKEIGRWKRSPASGADPAVSTENQLTVDNWPDYDGSLAPNGTRQGTSMAYDGDMVIITGGNDDEPLLMFNTRKNSWVSAESVFNESDEAVLRTLQADEPTSTSSTSSSTAVSTSTYATTTPSGNVPPADSPSHGARLNTVQLLFTVLGSILGACLILGCIFFLLRRRRAKNDAKRYRGAERRMSFQDRGASFMKEAGGSVSSLAPPNARGFHEHKNDSWLNVQRQASTREYVPSGTNFMDGPQVHRIGGQGVIVHPSQRTPSTMTVTRTPPAANDPFADPFQDSTVAGTDYGKERGSGWSRYFSGNSATNLVATPPRAYSGAPSSVYTESNHASMHQNPFLYNAGPGVVAGGMGVVSVQRAGSNGLILDDPRARQQYDRRTSEASMSSVASHDTYSSGIPESLAERPLWSQLDNELGPDRYNNNAFRSDVSSSVYPDSRRETDLSGTNVGSRHEGIDNLSWLNLRQN